MKRRSLELSLTANSCGSDSQTEVTLLDLPNDVWRWILFDKGDDEEDCVFRIWQLHILRFVCKSIHKTIHKILDNGIFDFDMEVADLNVGSLNCYLNSGNLDYIMPFAWSGEPKIIQWALEVFDLEPYEGEKEGHEFFEILAQNGHLECMKWLVYVKGVKITSKNVWMRAIQGNQITMLDGLKTLYNQDKCPQAPTLGHMLDVFIFNEIRGDVWDWWCNYADKSSE